MKYYICNTCGAEDEVPEGEDVNGLEDLYCMCESCYHKFIYNNPIMNSDA